ncbi:metal-dependent phosphohydrolase [Oscillochloris trichoides DG-6]|uniref:5'-deoxynucleotidase n=1 Tax=Oscillochloris trichoides DG-6 TaxID=765420 RepID=E1IIL2_9CHLR|nr:HD domain-containing protein [Oscillochloris trichoides]EFO78962.1 metal-dependent phosphohydrolase [Oscillochloris trichoides DG-6]
MDTNPHVSALFELQSRLMSLKLLPRTGWLQRGMRDVESIAEHTFAVASLAMLIGDQQPGLDRGRLLAIALLHDLAEALIGDLPASARRLFGATAKREAERRAMLELFAGLPQSDEYLALWDEYCAGASQEARLVKALDHLEMLAQALAYERAGSRALHEFWEDEGALVDEFPLVRALTDRLYAERNKLDVGTRFQMASG